MAKITKKSLLNLQPSDISKMKNPELRALLRGARQLYTQQEKVLNRYSQKVYSHAYELMKDYYEENGTKSVSRMRQSELRGEIFRLQEFFDSQSATVPGARKIALEQDKRIFGETKTGKPKRRMSVEQRKNFWSAYDEYKNIHSESYVRNMGSNTIQQMLAEIATESATFDEDFEDGNWFTADMLADLDRRVQERKESEDWETSGYDNFNGNVYSGKRPY